VELLIQSGASDPLFKGVQRILAPFPAVCSIRTSSRARYSRRVQFKHRDNDGHWGVSYPELISKGYDRKITLGSIAAGGTLGILIPPSIMMILYGSVTQNSVGKLL
jgi:hypothetical protein